MARLSKGRPAGHEPAYRLGRVLGADHTVVDDDDAVGEGVGLVEVMRRQHDRLAVVLEAADLVPEGPAGGGVEAHGGLV